MSLCVSFFLDGNIYVYADSRVSAYENGKSYYVHDDYNKLRLVGDKVIFTSGELDICDGLYAAINERSTVAEIAEAARQSYADFKRANPDYDGGSFGIEFGVYVHAIEDGAPVYYQLRYNDDFKVDRQVANNQELFAVAGRSEEALAIIDKLVKHGVTVDHAIVRAYERLANEIIGGSLVRYTLTAGGVEWIARPIRESKPLRKWSERGAVLHADMQGNVIARKITLTGTVENSDIKSGTITGALLRTAANGQRIEIDVSGLRAIGSTGLTRISIAQSGTYGVAGIEFNDQYGVFRGILAALDDGLYVQSSSRVNIAANIVHINGGTTDFFNRVDFSSATVSGLSQSSVSGLQTELSSLRSLIDGSPKPYQTATNMSFGPTTRNLKLYSLSGATLATVNIPK